MVLLSLAWYITKIGNQSNRIVELEEQRDKDVAALRGLRTAWGMYLARVHAPDVIDKVDTVLSKYPEPDKEVKP